MNRISRLLAVGGLFVAGSALAQTLELTENAVELSLGDITFPESSVGTLIYQACEDCDSVAVRVGVDTAWQTPRGNMTLADFREYVAELRQIPNANAETFVTVFRKIDDQAITRVRIHGRD